MNSRFLTANWKHLIFISYRVPESLLAQYLPPNLDLDCFEGSPLVSLVAFQFLESSFAGIRAPFWHSFAELNLRFYVKHKESGERGVVFIKEICPYLIPAAVALLFYNEKFLVMQSQMTQEDNTFNYNFGGADRRSSIQVACPNQEYEPQPGSIEHFVTDRYTGFSKWYQGSTLKYQVEHAPWKVKIPDLQKLQVNFEDLYGNEFAKHLLEKPTSVIYSAGSKITLSWGKRC